MSKQQQSESIDAIPVEGRNQYVLEQYRKRIDYYWLASSKNKKGYTWSRYLIIILGSVVTLITSLSASEIIIGWEMDKFLHILAPVLAATLTIVGGFSQNFHWGSAWREMVLTALELESKYHRLRVMPDDQRDPVAEMDKLHELILAEGSNFFDRLVGVASKEEIQRLDAIEPGNGNKQPSAPQENADE